jgi:predicted nucleic acid-binding protein
VRIVLDSSVFIDHLRGNANARAAVSERVRSGDELWGIVVTRAEVLAGMRSGERAETVRLLDGVSWLEIDVDIADDAGALARRFRRSHPGLQLDDCLIAAGTRRLGASLLTQNVQHFPMFEDLERAYE